jgi:acetoin utilization deacetylase AcuC-like enzyme
VFFDRAMLAHAPPSGHPEAPARLEAVMREVGEHERRKQVTLAGARQATEDDLLLVHSPEYVAKVRREVGAGQRRLSTGDTDLSAGSFAAAVAAVGAVLDAVDAVMARRAVNAFCAVRPPGHHASSERGMGFCLFNSIAIGARYARRRHGVERVLIADWDVHHGNGTEATFWRDGSVLFFDTHQHPWYPGTGQADSVGEGPARGLIVNRPFPAGAGRSQILDAFRRELVPAADRFKPDLVMISAGFDSRAGDPLGGFTLADRDFADLTGVVREIADRHAGGRLVSVLEGGYSIDGLPRAVGAHLAALRA